MLIVPFTQKNGQKFVVSDLLDFGPDDPPAFLENTFVIPKRIKFL